MHNITQGAETRPEGGSMNSYRAIVEKDTGALYIAAWRMYNGYGGEIEYGASVTSWDTLEDLEEISCSSEAEAVTAWARLVEKYR